MDTIYVLRIGIPYVEDAQSYLINCGLCCIEILEKRLTIVQTWALNRKNILINP